MNEIIIVDLPKPHGNIKGCWSKGYPIHKGKTEESLNYATVFANENNIIPDQEIIKKDFDFFKKTLKNIGFKTHILTFPEELNQENNLHHDAIFIRDSGFMFKNYWIQANFSVEDRKPEAEVIAKKIKEKFKKEIIIPPKNCFIEFGEVIYFKTNQGTFYFGGLSRSNQDGQDFVKEILKSDFYFLIKSEGYHLDTVFSPVISKSNDLIALIVTKNMLDLESLNQLKNLNVEIIEVDQIDSSGEDNELGNYAVNTLVSNGIILNSSKFKTLGVEEKLKSLAIKRFVTPLTYFRYAGGSCHCLTNEIYV